MNNPDSQKILERFFQAVDILIQVKAIRGINTFTTKYNIDRRNFLGNKKDLSRQFFQPAWLYYLNRDYGVSLEWLINDVGKVFEPNSIYYDTYECGNIQIRKK